MKYLLTIIPGISLLFGVSVRGKKIEFKDQKDRESYSLGYQFGQNLKNQGIHLNLDFYASGLRDAFGGNERQMTLEQIRSTIKSLRQRLMGAQRKAPKAFPVQSSRENF